MLRKLSLILFLSFLYNLSFSQIKESFWEKVYIGGNFGLQFGNTTIVNIAPQFGYRITDKLSSGLGITYIYYKYKDPIYNYSFSTDIYGGSIFARYLIYQNLFAYSEYEQLSFEVYDYFQNNIKRQWIPAMFVGGGYSQPIGDRSFAQITLLYDIIQDRYSPYQNPIIRIGFGFGF